MFLIRAAFWLSVVILLLPADPKSGTEAPRVSALQALAAAQATVADMSAFCERNPDVCVTGGAALGVLAEKAEYGARMIYEYLDPVAQPPAEPHRGTLSKEDVVPAWRNPKEGSA